MFTRCKWLLVHVYGLQLFVHIFNVECTEYNLRVTCAQARHSQTQRSNALLNIVERSKTYAYSMRDQFTCIGVFVWYKYKGQQIPALLLRIFAGKFLVNISCKMRQCWLTVFSTLLSICREIDSPYTLKWIERYQRYAWSLSIIKLFIHIHEWKCNKTKQQIARDTVSPAGLYLIATTKTTKAAASTIWAYNNLHGYGAFIYTSVKISWSD